ncbi:NINE protein [Pediococcus pentosaceus]|uniref:NINE protein n=1 Tax=Pediococcus pentosaceus TaxID=1255 RepID=UPI0018FE8337|nr:NINE protein [Pediococcus pentosaceus]MBF7130933.1 NINE protein [Pediococcus pentosaceus]
MVKTTDIYLLKLLDNKSNLSDSKKETLLYLWNIDFEKSLNKLFKDKLILKSDDPKFTLPNLKIPELKEILRKYSLKLSGNKSTLINRLLENVAPSELKDDVPLFVYKPTEQGYQIIDEKKNIIFIIENSLLNVMPSNVSLSDIEEFALTQHIDDPVELYVRFGDMLISEMYTTNDLWEPINISASISNFLIQQHNYELSLYYAILSIYISLNNFVSNIYTTYLAGPYEINLIKKTYDLTEAPDNTIEKMTDVIIEKFPLKNVDMLSEEKIKHAILAYAHNDDFKIQQLNKRFQRDQSSNDFIFTESDLSEEPINKNDISDATTNQIETPQNGYHQPLKKTSSVNYNATHYASQKSLTITYILCIFLGIFGAHRYYVGKIPSAVVMTLITLLTFGFGIFITAIWEIIDLFLISSWIDETT